MWVYVLKYIYLASLLTYQPQLTTNQNMLLATSQLHDHDSDIASAQTMYVFQRAVARYVPRGERDFALVLRCVVQRCAE